MSVCTNLGLDQSIRLGANTGYVVRRARMNAHSPSPMNMGNPWYHIHLVLYFGVLIRSSFGGVRAQTYIGTESCPFFNMPVFPCTRRMLPRTVCLRFSNFYCLPHAMRAGCYVSRTCTRFVLAACSIHVLSEIPQLFTLFAPRSTISRSLRLRRHVPFMYSRASRSFSCFALARVDCADIMKI
jgi:hypothetical protein